MKTYLMACMVFACNYLYAQVKPAKTPPMIQARIYLNKSNKAYAPPKAFEIYKQCASEGNARAMNILAVLYSEGTGTEQNQQEALKWFERSAQNGYDEAFFNLGNMYRTGWGTEQNFKLAYQWYEKGVTANSYACMYEQGYMLYKGLGVKQDYEHAVRLFRKGIKNGSLGSNYMLGLCFRNGYGITQNTDSARYLLNYAASKGYRFAKEELEAPVPENNDMQITAKKSGKGFSASSVKAAGSQTFQKVVHTAKAADIAGEYTGYVIRYDWSGQHVIGRSALNLKLEAGDYRITGTWTEDESMSARIQAELTDTALVFTNSAYQATDHYSAGKPVKYIFKNASLQVLKQKDSVYLAGNLQLWSATRNEPEKPVYISLVKTTPTVKQATLAPAAAPGKSLAVMKLVVYPNPFENSLQVSFELEQDANVSIGIADLLGKNVYSQNPRFLTAGKHSLGIQPQLPTGAYVLKLICNSRVTSAVIIKP